MVPVGDAAPHPRWPALLAWLKNAHGMQAPLVEARTRPAIGYGLVAVYSMTPGTALLTIPAKAMLNVATLSPLYIASEELTATQLISLHLLLYRPVDSGESLDPVFGPYISTLPNDFDYHPLSCLRQKDDRTASLFSKLPTGVMSRLFDLERRFTADCEAICQYLQKHQSALPKSPRLRSLISCVHDPKTRGEYLWAWLNVNTRCIYYRLKDSASDLDNLTLCPILDFANHTFNHVHMSLSRGSKEREMPGSDVKCDFTLFSPPSAETQVGDEVYLQYGAHSNATLFVEYGFVVNISLDRILSGEIFGEVDVQEWVEPLFEARNLGQVLKFILEGEGYWGDWTIHTHPAPAHPSYRLITALRLLAIVSTTAEAVPPVELQLWRDTITGIGDRISEANEEAWRETLLTVCEQVAGCAKSSLEIFERYTGRLAESANTLWREQLLVAQLVSESIRRRVEF